MSRGMSPAVLVAPATLVYGGALLLPLLGVLLLSLHGFDFQTGVRPDWGLENYRDLLPDPLFGEALLRGLGIDLASFRIAGGIMLFLIALEMVFERRTQRREDRAARVAETPEIEDVSIFPMAMPMIAGPGSIASVMLLMARNAGWERQGAVLAALAANLVLMLALLAAGPMMRLLGARIEAVITRLLGVLLAALAVQFVIDGLQVQLR